MTIIDYCISLNSVQKNLVVLGVVDMCHLLLSMIVKGEKPLENYLDNLVTFLENNNILSAVQYNGVKFFGFNEPVLSLAYHNSKTRPNPTPILGSGQIGPSGFKVGSYRIGLTSKLPKFLCL